MHDGVVSRANVHKKDAHIKTLGLGSSERPAKIRRGHVRALVPHATVLIAMHCSCGKQAVLITEKGVVDLNEV